MKWVSCLEYQPSMSCSTVIKNKVKNDAESNVCNSSIFYGLLFNLNYHVLVCPPPHPAYCYTHTHSGGKAKWQDTGLRTEMLQVQIQVFPAWRGGHWKPFLEQMKGLSTCKGGHWQSFPWTFCPMGSHFAIPPRGLDHPESRTGTCNLLSK